MTMQTSRGSGCGPLRLALAAGLLAAALPAQAGEGRPAADVREGRGADSAAVVRDLPPRRWRRADGAGDLRGRAALGAGHQGQDPRVPDNDPERMPPWFIEKNVGVQRFKNDISLGRDEIALIADWVDAGAPRGNPGRHAAADRVAGRRHLDRGASPT